MVAALDKSSKNLFMLCSCRVLTANTEVFAVENACLIRTHSACGKNTSYRGRTMVPVTPEAHRHRHKREAPRRVCRTLHLAACLQARVQCADW
jgi:hypothetical protein